MSNVKIIGIVTAFATVTEIMLIKAFSYGVKVGRIKDEKVPEPFTMPKMPESKPKITEEQKRVSDILHNIDVYDGTEIGQKEIKRGRTD